MKKAVTCIVILGMACLGLGIVIGIGIHKRYAEKHLPQLIRAYLLKHPKAERQNVKALEITKLITQELNLSLEQQEKLKIILEGAKPGVDQAREAFKVNLKEVREKAIADIYGILDPEQRESFKKMVTENRRRWGELWNK